MDRLDKNSLLKQLADNGYNVGFGAKKHFATYDIVTKLPGAISLIGLLIGVGQLAYPDSDYNTGISTVLIMASILALTISPYNTEKEKYEKTGVELTQLFNQLRALYYKVKNSHETEFTSEVQEMKEILDKYYSTSMSNQIFGSDWFAHYKFFWQMQIDWVNEQKNFSFWADKLPKSFVVFMISLAVVVYVWCLVFVKGGAK